MKHACLGVLLCYNRKVLNDDVPSFMMYLMLLLLNKLVVVVEPATCEPVRIAMCDSMPYNATSMPNLLHQSSQLNARLVIDQYRPLVATNCSDQLLFYLCSMYAPVCPFYFNVKHDAIQPCRAVCERARQGCEPVLRRYNLTWPVEFDCSDLPPYEKGICITPDSFESVPHNELKTPVRRQSSRRTSNKTATRRDSSFKHYECRCKLSRNSTKINKKENYLKRQFHYVVRATYQKSERTSRGSIVITVIVRQVLKKSKVHIPTTQRPVTLWSKHACVCARLRQGADLLLTGYEDVKHQKLIFDSRSLAWPWKNKWVDKIKKWESQMLESSNGLGKSHKTTAGKVQQTANDRDKSVA